MRVFMPTFAVMLTVLLLAVAQGVRAQEIIGARQSAGTRPADIGSGPGLAARYPRDVGIEKDPAVVFVENFEAGELKDICTRWGNFRADNMGLSDDVSPVSRGTRSLRIAWHGHLYTHHRPVDQLFARYYVKFHEKCGYTHHLPFIIADGEPTPWPKGWGGKKPRGDDFFMTGLDAWGEWGTLAPPGKWMLYTYWPEMKPDAHGDYWGTNFKVAEQQPIQRGRWICCEFMLKANSAPDKADGEQAFWIDGKLVGRFQGFRWRSTDDLKINSFWLNHDKDTHDLNADADHPNRVYDLWFDDIVLATEYIGPVLPKGDEREQQHEVSDQVLFWRWRIEKVQVEDVEAGRTPYDVPTGEGWKALKNMLTEGDELWYFDSPGRLWAAMMGCRGYALFRNGKLLAHVVTMEN